MWVGGRKLLKSRVSIKWKPIIWLSLQTTRSSFLYGKNSTLKKLALKRGEIQNDFWDDFKITLLSLRFLLEISYAKCDGETIPRPFSKD